MFVRDETIESNYHLRSVDICKYIDENAYREDKDDYAIYNSLWTILLILSKKDKSFGSAQDYQDFCLYGATYLYLRLTNPKQFLPEGDPKKLNKIKSILNYIKNIYHGLIARYRVFTSNEVFSADFIGEEGCNNIREQLHQKVTNCNQDLMRVDISVYLERIPKLIKSKINKLPHANTKKVKTNLYISCLLTFLRSITLSNKNKVKLFNQRTGLVRPHAEELMGELILEERADAPIIWHLPKEYLSLISVITNDIRLEIIKSVYEFSYTYKIDENTIDDILMQPLFYGEGRNE